MRPIRLLLVASLLLNLAFVSATVMAIHRLGGISYLAFKLKHRDDGSGYSAGRLQHLRSLDATLPAGKIVFVGDSITEAGEWSEFLGHGDVVNRGIGGDSTARILDRIESVAGTRPSKLFLMAGINDLGAFDEREVFDRYRQIVDTVKRVSPGTRIYLQSTLPVNREIRDTGRDNGRVAHLNALLAGLAARDDRVEWIDVGRALADRDGNLDRAYTYDGVHLNGAGYARWKAVILPYLQGTSVAVR